MSTCVYVLTSHNDITWSKSLVITGQNNRFAARQINALPVSVVQVQVCYHKKMVQCLTPKKSHCSFFTIHLNLTTVTEPLYAFVGFFVFWFMYQDGISKIFIKTPLFQIKVALIW